MNSSIKKTLITIEHHCLDLSYASIRLHKQRMLDRLVTSMEESGQLMPVIIVQKEADQWILIDGFLRVKALKRLGVDTVLAERWDCPPEEALIALLTQSQSRPIEAIEAALLVRELQVHHGYSQESIAGRIGKDKSWVSRRLALIEHVPDTIMHAVLNEKIPLWSAERVLGPLARANSTHAKCLLNYLIKNHHSTRELQQFYTHYQGANKEERSKIINELSLFFKVQKKMALEQEANEAIKGPEGQWQSGLIRLRAALEHLTQLKSKVFYPNQTQEERDELLKPLDCARNQFQLLANMLGDPVHGASR